MRNLKWIIGLMVTGVLVLIVYEQSKIIRTTEYLNGIELVGTVVNKRDFDRNISVCILSLEHSNIDYLLPEDETTIVEVCDTSARIIFRRGIKIGREFYEEQIFEVGSVIKFNINNDGWIREFKNGEEVNRIRAIRYKQPQELEPFCK